MIGEENIFVKIYQNDRNTTLQQSNCMIRLCFKFKNKYPSIINSIRVNLF